MTARSKYAAYRNAKQSGMSAEDVFAIVEKTIRDDKTRRPSEAAMSIVDALEKIEKVFGKRAAARCRAKIGKVTA